MKYDSTKTKSGKGEKMYEDEVREYAGYVLGFEDTETAKTVGTYLTKSITLLLYWKQKQPTQNWTKKQRKSKRNSYLV